MIEVQYNNLNLTAAPYNVTGYDGYNMPSRNIQAIELARTDGSIQVSERVGSRTVTVEGQIKTDSKPDLIAAIDQLKAYLYQPEGQLIVTDEDDITRTWACTPQNVAITRARGEATQATFSISFYCPKPYSTGETIELLNTTITTQPINLPISVGGSYPANPLIVLTINSITAGEQTITIGNQGQDRQIEITRAFTAGDLVSIDTATKEVFVNTVRTDYGGSFPTWQVGGGSISYMDTASARDIDIVVTHQIRNL